MKFFQDKGLFKVCHHPGGSLHLTALVTYLICNANLQSNIYHMHHCKNNDRSWRRCKFLPVLIFKPATFWLILILFAPVPFLQDLAYKKTVAVVLVQVLEHSTLVKKAQRPLVAKFFSSFFSFRNQCWLNSAILHCYFVSWASLTVCVIKATISIRA